MLPSEQAEATEIELEYQLLGYDGDTRVFQHYTFWKRNVCLHIKLCHRELHNPLHHCVN